MRRTALCFVAIASAGCSLLLSTSDLSEEARPDAGASPAGEAGADAPTTPAGDAGSDALAVDAADASGLRFCESLVPAPKFCADFDGTGPVTESWDTAIIDPAAAGSLARDPLGRDRASLLAKLVAPQSCSYVRPAKTFPTNGLGLRVAFAFRPSSPWIGDAVFSLMSAEGGDCGILFHFDGAGARTHFQYGNPEQDVFYDWDGAPKVDVWSRIEAAIDKSGALTVKLGDDVVFSQSLPLACTPGSEIYVAPGFHCEGDAHEARYDDVIVDYP
jgi:hypothetical protein